MRRALDRTVTYHRQHKPKPAWMRRAGEVGRRAGALIAEILNLSPTEKRKVGGIVYTAACEAFRPGTPAPREAGLGSP